MSSTSATEPGGQAWWLMPWMLQQEVKGQKDPELLVLETDNVLFKDDGFR